jgi:hypothetical protein
MAIESSSYTTTPAVSSGESTPPRPPSLSGQTTHNPKCRTEGHLLRHHRHHYEDLDQDRGQEQGLVDVDTLSLALRAYQEDDTVNNGHGKKEKKTNTKKKSRTRTTVIAATTTSAGYQQAIVAVGSIVPGTESGSTSDSTLAPTSMTKPIIIVQTETPESGIWEEEGEDTMTETETSASESEPGAKRERDTSYSSSNKKEKQWNKV